MRWQEIEMVTLRWAPHLTNLLTFLYFSNIRLRHSDMHKAEEWFVEIKTKTKTFVLPDLVSPTSKIIRFHFYVRDEIWPITSAVCAISYAFLIR